MEEQEKRNESTEDMEMQQDTVEPTAAEKVAVHEYYIGEILKASQLTGGAINRLETMLFSVIKILMVDKSFSAKELFETMDQVPNVENIFEWWGVPEEDMPPQAQEPQAVADPDAEENSD